jgi:hypothetical protein
MTAIPFDSHEFYSELVQSGLAEKTADALTKAVVKIEKAKLDELATKRDLKELELKIAESKADLTKTIILVATAHLTIMTGVMLKLAGTF